MAASSGVQGAAGPFYKVTTYDLRSAAFGYSFPTKYGVIYSQDDFVRPTVPNTKLFCFGDLDSAKRFKYKMDCGYSMKRLFECEVINPIETPDFIPVLELYTFNEFWGQYNENKTEEEKFDFYLENLRSSQMTQRTPPGSFLCDAIKSFELAYFRMYFDFKNIDINILRSHMNDVANLSKDEQWQYWNWVAQHYINKVIEGC